MFFLLVNVEIDNDISNDGGHYHERATATFETRRSFEFDLGVFTMFNPNHRRRVAVDTNAENASILNVVNDYANSLNELESSLKSIIVSFIHSQRGFHHRMRTSEVCNPVHTTLIRRSTIRCLRSILCLQTQLLKKYETLLDTGFPLDHPPATPTSSFHEDDVLEAFRSIQSSPEDWRRIRKILQEIMQYEHKKNSLVNGRLFVAVNTRPWINPNIIRKDVDKRRCPQTN